MLRRCLVLIFDIAKEHQRKKLFEIETLLADVSFHLEQLESVSFLLAERDCSSIRHCHSLLLTVSYTDHTLDTLHTCPILLHIQSVSILSLLSPTGLPSPLPQR